jgi:hypothetical protein
MNTLNEIKRYGQVAGIMIVFLLALVGIFSIGRCNRCNGLVSKISTQVDTLYLHDTIRLIKPIPKIIKNIDTIFVIIKDTIRLKDTVYLKLPREQKIYQEENYRAWISGYRPELDSINIFRNTQQIITSTTIRSKQKSHRWGIGIQAGYGITLQQNTIKPTQYIGIGVNYNLLLF